MNMKSYQGRYWYQKHWKQAQMKRQGDMTALQRILQDNAVFIKTPVNNIMLDLLLSPIYFQSLFLSEYIQYNIYSVVV